MIDQAGHDRHIKAKFKYREKWKHEQTNKQIGKEGIQ